MNYRVELTARAERDIDAILTWIADRSVRGAETWMRRLTSALKELGASAARCQLAPENGYGDTEIRHVVFRTRHGKPYRLLFSIRDDRVLVRHVRGPGQDLVPPNEL